MVWMEQCFLHRWRPVPRAIRHNVGRFAYGAMSNVADPKSRRNGRGVRVGVDVGGTFTDFVVVTDSQFRVFKVPSTPNAPEQAVLNGLREAGINAADAIVHGSTVATNSLLERRGANTVLVTTDGFRDVLEIGRQNRPELYELEPEKLPPLIPRERRLEVTERVGADGKVITPIERASLDRLESRVRRLAPDSAAVCLLFSFLRPSHERAVRAALRRAGVRTVSLSSEVLPEYREFERTSTTVVDAYVAPVMARYLRQLESAVPGPLWVVQSSGGVLRSSEASAAPVRTVLSGPAAGVVGAQHVARASGIPDIVTLDMGGTSTDVAVCPGEPLRTTQAQVAGLPVAIPMTDIHTVGAGGGSIAQLDEGGALRVGPRSAGAMPGPAAYGRGGTEPTVTDANVVLGRLPSSAALGGQLQLDERRANEAMEQLLPHGDHSDGARRKAALAVVAVANAHMDRALRVITLERGFDPRDFMLMPFGGAGPMHCCELAERLEIEQVLLPPYPGVLSALGALTGAHTREYSATVLAHADSVTNKQIRGIFAPLEKAARDDLAPARRPRLQRMLEMRYVGQSFELSVPLGRGGVSAAVGVFHEHHQQRYAHSRRSAPVEIVVARLVASVPQPSVPMSLPSRRGSVGTRTTPATLADGTVKSVPLLTRDELSVGFELAGPAVVTQSDATTWIPPGWHIQVDVQGALLLRFKP